MSQKRLHKKDHTRTTQETDMGTAQEVLNLIKENPEITQIEMSQKLNLTLEGVKYHIKKLKTAKKIKHVGATKKGHWELIKK